MKTPAGSVQPKVGIRDGYLKNTAILALEVECDQEEGRDYPPRQSDGLYNMYRWLELVLFVVVCVFAGTVQSTFSSRPWSVSLNVIATIPCWFFVDRMPVWQSYHLALLGTAISCWVRFFGFETTSLVLISVFSGLFVVLPARLSSEYFPIKERLFATGLGILALPTGHGIGSVVDTESKDRRKRLLVLATVCSIFFVLSLLWLSVLRSTRFKHVKTVGALKQMKLLFTNWAYIRILLFTSMIYAVSSAYILSLWDYAPSSIASESNRGLVGGTWLMCCVLGTMIFPVVCAKCLNGNVVVLSRILVVLLCVICYPVLVSGWVCNIFELSLLGIVGCGCFGFVLYPLNVEMGVELTYQYGFHSEGAITGLTYVLGNLMCYGLFALNSVGPIYSVKVVPFLSIGVILVSTVMYFTIPQRFLRRDSN